MSRATLLMVLGALVAFAPWSGFPLAWTIASLPALGLAIAAIGWSLRSRSSSANAEAPQNELRDMPPIPPARYIAPTAPAPVDAPTRTPSGVPAGEEQRPPVRRRLPRAPRPALPAPAPDASQSPLPESYEPAVVPPAMPSIAIPETGVSSARVIEESHPKAPRARRAPAIVPPSRASRIAKF